MTSQFYKSGPCFYIFLNKKNYIKSDRDTELLFYMLLYPRAMFQLQRLHSSFHYLGRKYMLTHNQLLCLLTRHHTGSIKVSTSFR